MILEKNNAARCAAMAKIRLSADEAAHYEGQLEELFEWVKQLSSVDVSGVELTAAAHGARLRPDEPVTDAALSETLINAFNDREGACVKVKKVL